MPGVRLTCVLLLAGLGAATSLSTAAPSPAPSVHPIAPPAAPSATPALRGAVLAGVPDPASFDVRAENRRRGTRAWRLAPSRAGAPGLGLATAATSVAPGDDVPLRLTGTGTAQVRALRIGWYGGAGARRVWHGTVALTGAAELGLPSDGWPPGHYLIRVDLGAAGRAVPVTVRSPSVRGRIVLVVTSTTAAGFRRDDASLVQQAERHFRRLAFLAAGDATARRLSVATAVVTGSGRWPKGLRGAVRVAAGRGAGVAVFGPGGGVAGLTGRRAGWTVLPSGALVYVEGAGGAVPVTDTVLDTVLQRLEERAGRVGQ